MSKILITNSLLTDYYERMRGESRILCNIYLGLKKLNYSVDITNNLYDDVKYDYELSWGVFKNISKHNEGLCMVVYPYELKTEENLKYLRLNKGSFITPYKDLIKYLNEESQYDVKYLPPLFPPPSYHVGFKDYNLNMEKSTYIKIFVYICSWEKYLAGNREIKIALECLKKRLENNGYKIKLYIQIDSESTKNDILEISKLSNEVEYVYKYRYNEYLRMIESMNIFIIKGSSTHSTAGMYDIISLGKPLLYIAWDFCNPKVYRNPLHRHPENIIFLNEDSKSITEKVNRFIDDPEKYYNTFRECIEDSNFDNWKLIVRNMFGELQE